MKKGEDGVWALTVGPSDPGTYRYLFQVDEVSVADPRNQAVSESNGNVWSVVHVPGSGYLDANDVPHGAVARVTYKSSALGRNRRMHVYTPPGYESGAGRYPVLFLLHGAGDSDDSWTSVGRANFILDNLFAAGKARPMVVVMPAGHTGPFSWTLPTRRPPNGGPAGNARFEDEFLKDIVPHVEGHYRVLSGPGNRAVAGLSMGGAQALNVAFARPTAFGFVGVFSSGIFLDRAADREKTHKEALAGARGTLKLLWLATGSEDFLLEPTKETVTLLKKNGLEPVFKETDGGHTWINWQKYLNEFAPRLFR